jgi:hypothetical protein
MLMRPVTINGLTIQGQYIDIQNPPSPYKDFHFLQTLFGMIVECIGLGAQFLSAQEGVLAALTQVQRTVQGEVLDRSKRIELFVKRFFIENPRVEHYFSIEMDGGSSVAMKNVLNRMTPSFFEQVMGFASQELDYSAEDLSYLGVASDQGLVSARELPCFAFALLKAKVANAGEIVKNFHERHLDLFLPLVTGRLKCVQVETPEKGDLVVYIKTDKVDHVGVCVGDGKVLSKPGILMEKGFTHGIYDIYGGNCLVAYFRPPQGLTKSAAAAN